MSEADRKKWDQRYAEGAYANRPHASEYLVAQVSRVAPGPALDVACGAGRNAIYLAGLGFDVDGVDISAVGLERAARRAAAEGVAVNWHVQDVLADMTLPRNDYQLIIMVRFVAPQLLQRLPAHLAPGGYLLVEEHLQWPEPVAGPGSNRFRVAPGDLRTALAHLEILDSYEGTVTDPDGATSAVARVFARKSNSLEER